MSICKVKDLPLNKMLLWTRAGIILYKGEGCDKEIVMGVDRRSGEYSNFGGTIKASDDNAISAANREFIEETLGVFGRLDKYKIEDCFSVYDDNEIIIFYPSSYDKDRVNKSFSRLAKPSSEMSGLKFFSVDEFMNLLTNEGDKIYSRVRNLLIDGLLSDETFL